MSVGKYVLVGVTVFLSVVSISILWQLLTKEYPTHSDVFFMGVEAGALAILLLVCLSLISYFLYRLALLSSKKSETGSGEKMNIVRRNFCIIFNVLVGLGIIEIALS